jgi:hypothetical protein
MKPRLETGDLVEYSPEDAAVLLEELVEVRERLSRIRYPAAVWNEDLDSLWPKIYDASYQPDATHESEEWSIGIDSSDRIWIESRQTGEMSFGTDFRWDEAAKGYRVESTLWDISVRKKVWSLDSLVLIFIDISDYYGYIFHGMIEACEASIISGNPIEIS